MIQAAVPSVPWYRSLTRAQWKALVASNLGWTFDGFEVFALILTVGVALHQLLPASEYPRIPAYAGAVIAIVAPRRQPVQFVGTLYRSAICGGEPFIFLPERIEAEGAALGPAFVHADRVWSVRTDRTVQNPNVARLAERATTLAALLRERLAAGAEPAASDRVPYEDVVLYLL